MTTDDGYTIKWVWDNDADLSWATDEERASFTEVLGCIVYFPSGQAGASLWGIVDPDDDYRRQVERDLIDEAKREIFESVQS